MSFAPAAGTGHGAVRFCVRNEAWPQFLAQKTTTSTYHLTTTDRSHRYGSPGAGMLTGLRWTDQQRAEDRLYIVENAVLTIAFVYDTSDSKSPSQIARHSMPEQSPQGSISTRTQSLFNLALTECFNGTTNNFLLEG